jgi:sigma-E factor negative regulatory protein RseA
VQPEFTDEEKVEQVRRINAFVLDHQLQKRIQQ